MRLVQTLVLALALGVPASGLPAPVAQEESQREGAAQFSDPLRSFNVDDPIWFDPDNLDFPKPEEWNTLQLYDVYENLFLDRGDPARPRAVNINTIGEVPDSSWFTNRLGVRDISVQEFRQGPNLTGGPAPGNYTVIGRPIGGITPKFLVEDSAGQRFIFKFDPMDFPEMASAADMVCSKIFWAAGYRVAEGYLTTVRREQLVPGEGAVFTNDVGERIPIGDAEIDRWMENAPQTADGSYRLQASKFIAGEQVGEFRFFGTRSDDPNDIFPHEHRRELRGYKVLAAWLNHDDSRATNTFDSYVQENGRGYITHYLLDFGSCLGSASIEANKPRGGNEYFLEGSPIWKSLFTFGIWHRPWLDVEYPDYEAIGHIEAEYFKPELWKPEYPNAAFDHMDRADAFWAARIVARVSDEAIRAAVDEAQISESLAARVLADIIIQRRDKVVATWLPQTNPLDDFEVPGSGSNVSVRWDNAAIRHGLASATARYDLQWYSFDNEAVSRTPVGGAATVSEARASVPTNAWGPTDSHGSRYASADIATQHADFPHWEQPVVLTLRNRNGEIDVVGLVRPR